MGKNIILLFMAVILSTSVSALSNKIVSTDGYKSGLNIIICNTTSDTYYAVDPITDLNKRLPAEKNTTLVFDYKKLNFSHDLYLSTKSNSLTGTFATIPLTTYKSIGQIISKQNKNLVWNFRTRTGSWLGEGEWSLHPTDKVELPIVGVVTILPVGGKGCNSIKIWHKDVEYDHGVVVKYDKKCYQAKVRNIGKIPGMSGNHYYWHLVK